MFTLVLRATVLQEVQVNDRRNLSRLVRERTSEREREREYTIMTVTNILNLLGCLCILPVGDGFASWSGKQTKTIIGEEKHKEET